MQTKHNLSDIKFTLRKELSEALNEGPFGAEIEISEINTTDTYSIKGSFKVVSFLSTTVKRKGKFETKLDENLKIVTLKITDDQQ